jgi:hypothetical protein
LSTQYKKIVMELEKFEQAKKVKENLERLKTQKHKLESALKSCSLGVTIKYMSGGQFRTPGEVGLYDKEIIKEMISKVLEKLDEEINLVKEEFEKV